MAAYLLIVIVMAGGLWRVETSARDANDAAGVAQRSTDEVHREVARSEEERCRITLLSRQGSLDKDIRIFTRIGRQFDVDPEQMEILLDGIREDYESLPVPADCR